MQKGLIMKDEILLRKPDVLKSTGLSRSGLQLAVSKGQFPKPVRISTRAVAWQKSLVQKWISTRIELG